MDTPRSKPTKREFRKDLKLTRPPRLEGKVKNAMMDPVRKKKAVSKKTVAARKPQGYSDAQRKNYQLKSKRS